MTENCPNFPFLEEAVGEEGQIITLDLTPAMLAEARDKDPQARAVLVAALVLGGVLALEQGPMVGEVPVVSAVLLLLALLLGWKLLK